MLISNTDRDLILLDNHSVRQFLNFSFSYLGMLKFFIAKFLVIYL